MLATNRLINKVELCHFNGKERNPEREGPESSCDAHTPLHMLGRDGPTDFMNGTYEMLADVRHDGRPVFLHTHPIPRGFQEASGEKCELQEN